MPLRSTVPLAPVAFVACFAFVAPDARADDASKTESRDPPAQPALLDTPDDEPVLVVTPKVRDEEISIAFRGALQVRGLLPFGATASQHARADGDLAEETAFELRRVRLGLDAMILPTATVHVSADLVDSLTPAWTKTPLFLAYANLDTRIIQVRAGLVRVPFTRHGLVDETRQVFLEPAAAWRSDRVGLGRGAAPSVLPDRRVGVELHEETDGYALSLGAFSGGGVIGTESGSSAIFAGRLELAPWGAVPLEGAYFRGDAAYTLPRVTFALGGLARAGLDGGGRFPSPWRSRRATTASTRPSKRCSATRVHPASRSTSSSARSSPISPTASRSPRSRRGSSSACAPTRSRSIRASTPRASFARSPRSRASTSSGTA